VLVFVYGSLCRGEEFHHYLADARFVGPWRTPPTWEMWDLDGYPALTPGGQTSAAGELYDVSEALLARLDELEETPTLYQRTELDTPYGRAFVYVVFEPPASRVPIPGGVWTRRG
jgi:gamma-glutamylcyclotransferase (GGCT)/AIG2-like uncharacterized protein YtfP